MGQMQDGKIAVGLAQLWHSDIAIDEIKMASDINEWARKYHPTTICYDKYEGEMNKLLREIANEGSADSMEVDTFMKSLGLDPEKNK